MKKFIIFLFIINNSPLLAQFCYLDRDHDGYGDPSTQVASTIFGCPPNTFGDVWVTNGLDCNDNNDQIHPGTVWYENKDGDKFTTGKTLHQCSRPEGYSLISELFQPDISCGFTTTTLDWIDCDDSNPNDQNSFLWWFIDNDHDGFVNTLDFIISACIPNVPGVNYLAFNHGGAVCLLPIDCNDNSTLERPGQKWYPDMDNDGYAGSFTFLTQCTRPANYKAASELLSITVADCNDNDAGNFPALWWQDADGDGYTSGTQLRACQKPAGYIATPLGNDCDDSDPNNHNSLVFWYPDADGDKHGKLNANGTSSCGRPPGYFKVSELLSRNDCNDNNSSIYPGAIEICDNADNNCNEEIDEGVKSLFIQDADGDGAGNPAVFVYACSAAAGYIPFTIGFAGDCNDNDPAIISPKTYYRDADNDGYGEMVGLIYSICSVTAPSGYSANNTDCNDNNATVHSKYVFYGDNDGDGYGAGTSVELCAVSAATAPTGYSVNNIDCNDNNVVIHPATVWYRDADNDGYSNGATLTQCTRPGNHKLASELTSISGDCNDNNAILNPATTWYKDADNDGYSNGTTQTQCARPANHKLASELTSISGDCNDVDPTINPASVEVCSNNKDDNCNGTQNEAGCYTCGNGTSFSTTNVTSNSATLNWVSIPHPNHWQLQYKSTAPGTKWIDVTPDPAGNQRSVTINGLTPNKNYLWHIKAKCGNGWTSYSISIPFTTAGGATTRSQTNTNAEMEVSEVAIGSTQVKATPNPSNTNFRITLNSSDLKEPVKLIITDMLGRVIETRTTNAGQIIIGEKYRSGTYLVRIIQGKETRQLKLIKLPD